MDPRQPITEEQAEYAAANSRTTLTRHRTVLTRSPERVDAFVALDSEREHWLQLPVDIAGDLPDRITVTVEPDDLLAVPVEVHGVRRFFLHRTDDVTGVHDDGVIAIGVRFDSDVTVLRWLPGRDHEEGSRGSTATWSDFDEMTRTHMHPRSNTTLVWVD